MMLYAPAYRLESKPYSDTLYPTSLNLDSLPALMIGAQRKTNDWLHPGPHGLCETFRVTLSFGTRGEED